MARYDLDSVVTQSLLDRLIDREPHEQAEATMTRAQSVRALKASVRRDLEWLLNTRRIPEEAGGEYPEASRSLFNYGLQDFSAFSLSNPKDRLRLLRSLETAVEIFEPRLQSIRVVLVDRESSEIDRSIRFQIEGLLKMDPAPEQITFDTVLSLTSGEYQIKGDRG
jgi:type VI secretion system protein ImpF